MNVVILSGNLTRDPECVQTKSGLACCKFSIAVQRKYSDTNGERGVDFFNCVAWRQTADYCYKYFEKGKRITIEGHLLTNEYQTSDGTKRQSIDIVVDNVEIAFTRSTEGEKREDKPRSEMTPVDEDDLPF